MRRCNIERVEGFPFHNTSLPLASTPYIVSVPAGANAQLASMLRRDALMASMGDVVCTPTRAGSTRDGMEVMLLRDYMQNWMDREVQRDSDDNRYVFGEFGDEWLPFREAYNIPNCSTFCERKGVAITIGLGGLHSGAPWHFHNEAFIEMLHGGKHIALLPPGDEAIPEIDWVIKRLSQFHWHEEFRSEMEERGLLKRMQECALWPGDLLFMPDRWHHGVVNLAPYTAFVSTFMPFVPKKE